MLTGTAGGIIGTITMFIAIIWSIVYPLYWLDLISYGSNLEYLSVYTGWPAIFVMPYPYYTESLFFVLVLLLVVLLIVTSILVGIGFYGTYRIGGGAMGTAALIVSIIGTTIAAIIIFLGSTALKDIYHQFINIYPYPWATPEEMFSYLYLPVYLPGFLWIWLGCIILGVTFIVMGAASIVVREVTGHSSSGMAGGILSIIGGPY